MFGSSLETLAKPLFFFHLVVAAGPTNERIANAQRTWGSHNYRVYRISDAKDRQDLVADVLRQHRRVSNRVDIARVVRALQESSWGNRDSTLEVLRLFADLRFDTSYLYALARIALGDPTFLPAYAQRVIWLAATEEPPPTREGYQGGPGDYVGGLLELALVVASGELADNLGPEAFEKWATSSGSFPRVIDAAFGLSRDYDGFILGVAPYQYALAAAVLRDFPYSLAWVVRDLHRLLVAGRASGVAADYQLIGGVWLPHLLRLAGVHAAMGKAELEEMYAWFEQSSTEAGGVPHGWLSHPPLPDAQLEGLNTYVSSIGERVNPPAWELFAAGGGSDVAENDLPVPGAAIEWCLEALIESDVYARPTIELITLLRPLELRPRLGDTSQQDPLV